jgi:pectinesterase
MRAGVAGLALAVVIGSSVARDAAGAQRASPYAAVVDARHGGRDGDSIAGAPVFRSLGAALASLPANGGARSVIYLRNGRYREKLTIDRPRITLRGENRDSTILTFDAAAGMPAPGGGTYGTRGSYTLRIVAPDVRVERMTIENAFDYMANAAKAAADSTKLRDPQGVALMLDQGSDRAAFVDVRILGHQDTLFPNAGRSWFHRCEITGSVDFIFGAGQAVFEQCDIVSRDRGSRTNNGYVTAPSTAKHEPFGFLFLRCRLLKERATMSPGSVSLGRPWHPFGDPEAVGSAVFIDTWMDDHVGAKGWERMSSTDSTGARVWWEPETARFFEHGTRGPGAVTSPARRQLSAGEASRFTTASVLRGWAPAPN